MILKTLMMMTVIITSEITQSDETISACLFASFILTKHVVVILYYVFHCILKNLIFSLICFSLYFKKVISSK